MECQCIKFIREMRYNNVVQAHDTKGCPDLMKLLDIMNVGRPEQYKYRYVGNAGWFEIQAALKKFTPAEKITLNGVEIK